MWNRMKEITRTFAYVLMGVEIATATFISIFYPGTSLSVSLLWEILACSFVCTLGNIIWWTERRLGRTETAVRIALHYLYINVVVFGSAFVFDWIDIGSIAMVLSMFMMILVIFVIVFLAIRHHGNKISELMNRSLRAYQGHEGE